MLVLIKENASNINIYQEETLMKKSDTPFSLSLTPISQIN